MLKGEAKKSYQREYMREYQRKHRSKQLGLNKGLNNSSIGLNNVKTQDVKTHKDIIKELQAKIDTVKPEEHISIEKHYCQQCKAYGRRKEAIEQGMVYDNEQERLVWLCKEHLTKCCVNV